MAKIIIQGPKEEVQKAESSLKQTFGKYTKITSTKIDEEVFSVVDVYAQAFGKDHFTNEEIEKAMRCCSNKERDCLSCPYRKEDDCIKKMQIDASVMLQRLYVEHCRQEKLEKEKLKNEIKN